jgi:heat shock protein HtpX
MTVAASAGIAAGLIVRWAQFGAIGRSRDSRAQIGILGAIVISLVVYAVSFLLLRLLSRYREMCADRAGAYLTQKPSALASALQKISGDMASIPTKDLRSASSMNALFIAPAVRGASLRTIAATHPPLEQRLEQLAKIQAELGRPLG